LPQRQTVVNACTRRAQENTGFRQALDANRQVDNTIMQAQGDLMAYLANTNLVDEMATYERTNKQAQGVKIVGSHAAVNALCALMEARDNGRARYTRAIGDAWLSLTRAKQNWDLNCKFEAINKWNTALKFGRVSRGLTIGGGAAGAAAALFVGFAFPSTEEILLGEIDMVKK
jgi:hypothetical protein